jgi:flavodoxin
MKIGIIVHSYSGNTTAVAHKIQGALIKAGHSVDVEQIKILGGEQPNTNQFQIESPPGANRYDALIFGAPVRGFSISPVIATYLNQLSNLSNKNVICFVTKQLSSNWTGGTSAIKGMKNICESKGGSVIETGIVFWKSKKRKRNRGIGK